jgi:hypothetical protein
MFDAGEKSTSLGETIAMALAEQGNFAQAISIQRDVMAAARRDGSPCPPRHSVGQARPCQPRLPVFKFLDLPSYF